MDIGTAKVAAADRARVPHHGLDLVDPDEPFTAADFRAHALDGAGGIAARGRVADPGRRHRASTCGSSRAACRSRTQATTPRCGPTWRRAWRRRASRASSPSCGRLAPDAAARTDLANPRRVVRALERARLLGDVPPPQPAGYPAPSLWLGTRLERAAHDRVILDARPRAVRDVACSMRPHRLRERYGDDLRSYSAMGYREAFAVLDGRRDRGDRHHRGRGAHPPLRAPPGAPGSARSRTSRGCRTRGAPAWPPPIERRGAPPRASRAPRRRRTPYPESR